MTAKSIAGKWKGSFTYGKGYGARTGKSVEFTFELSDNDGEFKGFSIDSETKGLIFDPITVKGFWEDELISFTMQYPYYFTADDDGKIIVDRKKANPEMIFSGEFLEATGKYTGDWEIPADSKEHSYESDLTLGRGTWEMAR